MAEMTFRDRLKIAALSAERSQRSAIAQKLAPWLPAWSVASTPRRPAADRAAGSAHRRPELLARDRARAVRARRQHRVPARPLAVRYRSRRRAAWERELHGFGWLRNLAAATDDDEARRTARLLASEWAIRFGGSKGVASEPAVAARRLISWISHATLLLEGADAATYEADHDEPRPPDRAARRLAARRARRLSASAHPHRPHVCRAVRRRSEAPAEGHRADARRRAAPADPARRRPHEPQSGRPRRADARSVAAQPMLRRAQPRAASASLSRCMARMLAHAALPAIGRRHACALQRRRRPPRPPGSAPIVAYGDAAAPLPSEARASGYARLARGTSIVVVDVGSPPPLAVGGDAQAGCLSFEMSAGRASAFRQRRHAGRRGRRLESRRARDRQPQHAVSRRAVLRQARGATASARRVRRSRSASPTTSTGTSRTSTAASRWKRATTATSAASGSCTAGACQLAADGTRLEGRDRLARRASATCASRSDVPFAIHFHLHPDVSCRMRAELERGRAVAARRRALAVLTAARRRAHRRGKHLFRQQRRAARGDADRAARRHLRQQRDQLGGRARARGAGGMTGEQQDQAARCSRSRTRRVSSRSRARCRDGRGADLDRRHRGCAARRRAAGEGCRRADGLSRDARRAREDAAPERARRAPGRARQRRAREAGRSARHRADRSAWS